MIVHIEVTTHCNFDCVYCYTKLLPNKMLSLDTFKKIVDPYLNDSVIRFMLQGEGEPLLHPQFWDMVKYLTDFGHSVQTTTNGSALTEENQNNIIELVDFLTISGGGGQ